MRVNLYATLRPLAGGKSVDLDLPPAATVAEAVAALCRAHPALADVLLDARGALAPHVHVFVNGRDAPYLPGGLHATLTSADTLDVFPAVAGG